MIIEAIAKREDVSPKEGISKHGNVTFADPKNKKYPINTDDHVRAALSYWGQAKNRAKYSSADQKLIGARIRAAARKRGIGEAAKNGNGKTESQNVPQRTLERILTCELPSTFIFDGEAPAQILYLPKGRSTIHARVNGEPKTVSVEVNEGTAALLQSQLRERLAKPVKPRGFFNHRQNGPASFIPTEAGFIWDEKRGVILNVDWSKSGREAIEGRDYNHFSPSFKIDDKDQVVGLSDSGPEIGSLTNSPAFEHIGEIAAQP